MSDDNRPPPSAADLAFVRAFVAEQAKFQNSISRRMLDTAYSYLAGASVLGRFMDQTKDSKPAMGVALCQSLALEIYFKALVALHHDEASLYSHLPADFRKGIREHELPKLVGLMASPVRSTLIRMFGMVSGKPLITLDEFMELLEENAKDIFYSWRYLYEYSPDKAMRLDLTLLSRLINAAQLTFTQYQKGAIDKWPLAPPTTPP